MRVLKNLLGDGSKIHAGEIQVNALLNLMNSVIVKEGSNDDGNYIEFGNGWKVATSQNPFTIGSNSEIGVIFDFPTSFTKLPFVIESLGSSSQAIANLTTGISLSMSDDRSVYIRIKSPLANTHSGTCFIIAIGR